MGEWHGEMAGARLGRAVEARVESGRWPCLRNRAAAGQRGELPADLRSFGQARGGGPHPFASW